MLSVEDLLKLRLVCRSWKFLIDVHLENYFKKAKLELDDLKLKLALQANENLHSNFVNSF